MSRHTAFLSLLTTLALFMGACAGDAGGDGDGDGDGDPYDCESGTPVGGEPFSIELGLRAEDNSFIALADGDPMPVVLGLQGLYMSELRLQARIVAPADAEQVCFDCTSELSPAGSFAGISQPEKTRFTEQTDDVYSGFSTLLLGSYDQLEGGAAIEGQQVELAMACDGHGFSGSGQVTVTLTVSE